MTVLDLLRRKQIDAEQQQAREVEKACCELAAIRFRLASGEDLTEETVAAALQRTGTSAAELQIQVDSLTRTLERIADIESFGQIHSDVEAAKAARVQAEKQQEDLVRTWPKRLEALLQVQGKASTKYRAVRGTVDSLTKQLPQHGDDFAAYTAGDITHSQLCERIHATLKESNE